jgi:hypothetical protein
MAAMAAGLLGAVAGAAGMPWAASATAAPQWGWASSGW